MSEKFSTRAYLGTVVATAIVVFIVFRLLY